MDNKIDYKIKVGKKSIDKSITLKELSWPEWCKIQDIQLVLSNPNGALFTNASNYVQIHLGKTDEEMIAWRDGYDIYGEFQAEIFILTRAITESYNTKKK